jgi:hypothetical protein
VREASERTAKSHDFFVSGPRYGAQLFIFGPQHECAPNLLEARIEQFGGRVPGLALDIVHGVGTEAEHERDEGDQERPRQRGRPDRECGAGRFGHR